MDYEVVSVTVINDAVVDLLDAAMEGTCRPLKVSGYVLKEDEQRKLGLTLLVTMLDSNGTSAGTSTVGDYIL